MLQKAKTRPYVRYIVYSSIASHYLPELAKLILEKVGRTNDFLEAAAVIPRQQRGVLVLVYIANALMGDSFGWKSSRNTSHWSGDC